MEVDKDAVNKEKQEVEAVFEDKIREVRIPKVISEGPGGGVNDELRIPRSCVIAALKYG